MDSVDFSTLNRRFAIAGHVAFAAGPGGLTVAAIANSHAEATIALQGAHVMSYQPTGQQPVLWLSSRGQFVPGKPIRGGIPLCWPWFGAHATDPNKPAHGFARSAIWEVLETAVDNGGATKIRMGLVATETTRALWPRPSHAQVSITVGPKLQIKLITGNLDAEPWVLSEALHTYFRVGDIGNVRVLGLEGCDYLDKVDGLRRKTQRGPVTIAGEVDRIYLDTEAECLIEDGDLGRRIRIVKKGSRSTVVWNPWSGKSAKMGDFGPQDYRSMVCVESANAAQDVVTLAPGGEHELEAVIGVETLT